MCSEISQSIPNSAVIRETMIIPLGIAAHAGSPETRWLNAPSRPSTSTRPLRWPMPSQSRRKVTTQAAPAAIATWSRAAPAAGFATAIHMGRNVTPFDVTFCDVTPLPGKLSAAMAGLTIDELARETGLTVRNVRSHHARGLLPPPEVRGRTGFYGPEHVQRLRLIQELQQEGLKLDGIKRLLGDSGERLLALKQAAGEPPEPPEVVTAAELEQRLGRQSRKALAKAEKLGMLIPLGDGHFEIPSPVLLAAAEEVVSRGVSLEHALDMLESVERHSRAVSREFIKLFMEDVIKPFADAGMPEERWGELAESVEHVRPLAAQALLAVFRRTMDEEIEATFADMARRLASKRR